MSDKTTQTGDKNIILGKIYDSIIKINQSSGKEKKNSFKVDYYLKKFVISLGGNEKTIGRYQNRYDQKLDERLPISLKVKKTWESQDAEIINIRFEKKKKKDSNQDNLTKKIKKIFKETGTFLILGNPGSGKTVLLLKLANELLEDIKDIDLELDFNTNLNIEKKKIPVIFNLASWSEHYDCFDKWIIEMLFSSYGLSKGFAKKLLEKNRIIFLLDGLDELARNKDEAINEQIAIEAIKKREKCLTSLIDYLTEGRDAIVCCRTEQFEQIKAFTGEYNLFRPTVEVLDLTDEQVELALKKAIENNKYKKAAINLLERKDQNKALAELLLTPFYLNISMTIFNKVPLKKEVPNDLEILKIWLLEEFIEAKLRKSSFKHFCKPEKTKAWLKGLAKFMSNKKKPTVTFELADLQPVDLVTRGFYKAVFTIIGGLTGVLVTSVYWFLLVQIHDSYNSVEKFEDYHLTVLFSSLLVGLTHGIPIGFTVGLGISLLRKEIKIKNPTKLDLSLFFQNKNSRNISSNVNNGWLEAFFIGSVFSLLYISSVLFFYLIYNKLPNNIDANALSFSLILYNMLVYCFFVGSLVWILFSIIKTIERYSVDKPFTQPKSPYQRLNEGKYIKIFLVTIIAVISLISLMYYISLFDDPDTANTFSLAVFLDAVGFVLMIILFATPMFKHFVLRLVLYFEGAIPLRYATFLNYAVSLRILEKDGGQWRFRHQLLQDYFADKNIIQ